MQFVKPGFNKHHLASVSYRPLFVIVALIVIVLSFSLNLRPLTASTNAPSTLSASRISSSNVQLNWRNNTTLPAGLKINLAWFYLPHENMNFIRQHFDTYILSRNFETERNRLKNAGKSPVLQYIAFDSIHDPCYQARNPVGSTCSCNQSPLNNNVGWNANDVCWIRDNHRDWFLRDSNGNIIYSGFNGGNPFVIMDPGKQGWRDFFLSRIRQTQNNGWDGIMLDNLPEIFTAHTGQRVALRDYTDTTYHNAVVGFLDYIGTQYFDSRSNKPIYANFSALWDRNPRYDRVVAELDGVMDEYWAVTKTGYYPILSFEKRLQGAVRTLDAGKRMIMVSQGGRNDNARQQFALATYLLVASDKTSFRYTEQTSGGYREPWLYDNYNTYLGDPQGNYYRSGDRFHRNFTHGRIWVDPLARTSAILPNEIGFEVQRSTNGGQSFSRLATVGFNITSYTDTTAQADYCYRVRFYNGTSRSSFSEVTCVNSGTMGGSDDAASGPQVNSLRLINATTGQAISGFSTLNNNAQINLSQLPSRINIQAAVSEQTRSVRFNLTGTQSRTQMENVAPYDLFGDAGGQLPVGNYTLTVTPFTASSGGGTRGEAYTISFSIINSTTTTGGSDGSSTNPLRVETISLMSADTNRAIITLNDGAQLDLATLPTRRLNIDATAASTQIKSMYFQLSGAQSVTRNENVAPYALFGDNAGIYFAWTPRVGSYTLRITPYTSTNRQGQQGEIRTISFTVVDSSRREDDPIEIMPLVLAAPVEAYAEAGLVRPVFTWSPVRASFEAPFTAEWYNIIVVDLGGAVMLDGWASAAESCTEAACYYTPDAAVLPAGLVNGEYVWWVRAWGENVFSDVGDEGLLSVSAPAPALVTELYTSRHQAGYTLLHWRPAEGVSWYQVWVGTLEGVESYSAWYEGAALGCAAESWCSITLTMTLPEGEYIWYVQGWGPGGYSVGGIEGWAEGPAFTP